MPESCIIDGCDRMHYAHGWCALHYGRWRRGVPRKRLSVRHPPAERFERFVDRQSSPNGCWLWTGKRDKDGYGRFQTSARRPNGTQITAIAHRFSYELHVGPIPEGLLVLHACDNPPCVNPAHLFVGTQADNIRDCVAKGRHGRAPTTWKLTREQYAEIKGRSTGRYGERAALAREYGVSPPTITRILNEVDP